MTDFACVVTRGEILDGKLANAAVDVYENWVDGYAEMIKTIEELEESVAFTVNNTSNGKSYFSSLKDKNIIELQWENKILLLHKVIVK